MNKIREDMHRVISEGYDPDGFKMKLVDEMLVGIGRMRADAHIDDIPMRVISGLRALSKQDLSKTDYEKDYSILDGEKDGWVYEFSFEQYDDMGQQGMCLALYRFVEGEDSMYAFNKDGDWKKVDF